MIFHNVQQVGIEWSSTMKNFIKESGNLVSIVLSLITGGFFWIFSRPNASVPMWVLYIVVTLWVVAVWLFVRLLLITKDTNNFIKEELRIIQFKNINNMVICLIEKNPVLVQDSIITFYKNENKFENYLATGYIFNIQNDGCSQAEIVHIDPNYQSSINKMVIDGKLDRNIIVKNVALRSIVESFLLHLQK